jgi:hypothetical protein
MNTVITPIVDENTNAFIGYDMNEELGDHVVKSLIRNNTFIPNIDHIVFNTKTDGETPILATVVYFVDGTKVTVKNSKTDKIELVEEEVTSIDGNVVKVKTASRESREIGLLYALLKRAVCKFDNEGRISGEGFATFLKKKLKSAYRQDVEEALANVDKAAKKEARKEAKNAPVSSKKDKTSLKDTVKKLSETIDYLSNLLKSQKEN